MTTLGEDLPPPDPDFRHPTPPELVAALRDDAPLRAQWDGLTDIGRNDYICWMTSPKTDATRAKRFERLKEEVTDGKRRPCCFPGCPHRLASARGYG
ncbi:YdeI/OmpD-associated family protein [Sphingomicrobium arenosum]|uniref:YdeI/OmpD-associated family protein n=1 Tax=Sphingomicrobium arenosum TaxID=2233861 RepID=UPI00223F3C2D|nr:YdeI/OmpD-associated family protein [Sphingomicrobium arenosum]